MDLLWDLYLPAYDRSVFGKVRLWMKNIHGGDIYRNRIRLDFSVNVNPFGVPESVKHALEKAAGECCHYPDIEAERLKEAVSEKYGILKDRIIFGNGASELFMGIVHALRPEKVLIPVPSFYGYEYAARAVKNEIRWFVLKEEEDFFLREDFLDVLTEETDLLFLADPNNPTGKRIEKDVLEKILRRCREKGITVVLDECFIEFCGEEYSMLEQIEEYENLLLVRAFTKSYAIAGVRLGYLAGSSHSLLEQIKCQLPEWNLSVFAQAAGIACIKEENYLERSIRQIRKERAFLENGLKELGIRVFSGEADFLLIDTDKAVYEQLLKRGILIRDCSNFRGLRKGYYRIAVRLRAENEELLKAMGECIGKRKSKDRTAAAGRD